MIKVGIITSALFLRTGFTTNAKALLPYLYRTGKYEIFHLNQGIGEGHQDFLRYPWKNEGVFRAGGFDEARFNQPQEEGYRRLVSYGNLAVQDFIIKNRLDALIHIEDIWSADNNHYINAKWFPMFKNNFLHWTTADSLPILPQLKEQAERMPNIWVWASFAEHALHNENKDKFGHVKYVPGCVDPADYYPIGQDEKTSLRSQFGIPTDCFVFLFLGRNQLRKLFPACLESLAKFKQVYPSYKDRVKLFFHCSWSEMAGWPLERLVKDFGLAPEDVLTTYYCRQCSKWEVKYFAGEDQNCPYCGTQRAQATAGVGSTISNKELSKIYGVADGCLSVFTSGGLEMHSVQSLLCKQPLLCTEYSCGEDFIKNEDFVFKLDGMFTYEVGTGFKKHVPNQDTMVKFFHTVVQMSPDEREKITTKGRDWALRTFHYKVIGAKIEQWLDSLQPHGWNFELSQTIDIKNPTAIIPVIENDGQWIIKLYKDILNMSVDEQDSGFQYWMKMLNSKMPRKQIEEYFRKVALDENNKNKQINLEDLLDKTGRKRFLLVAPESIGDLINITALFHSFVQIYPDHDFYLATKPEYFDIFDGNSFIYKVIPFIPPMDSEIAMTGQGDRLGLFDKYCHITARTQKLLSYLTQDKIALNLKAE